MGISIKVLILFFLMGPLKTEAHDVAISQGVSSPTYSHVSIISNGFTFENPVAVAYQTSYHATVEVDGTDPTSGGLDLGLGDGEYGLGLGVYSNGCENCNSFVRGTLGAIWGSFGMGVGFQDGLYTFGAMINPNGLHRVGLVLEMDRPRTDPSQRSASAVGYSFVMPKFTFSLDFSHRTYKDDLINSQAMMLTPGIAVTVDVVTVSLSYDSMLDDSANDFNNQVWFAFGFQATSSLYFSFYGEYNNRWSLLGKYTF